MSFAVCFWTDAEHDRRSWCAEVGQRRQSAGIEVEKEDRRVSPRTKRPFQARD